MPIAHKFSHLRFFFILNFFPRGSPKVSPGVLTWTQSVLFTEFLSNFLEVYFSGFQIPLGISPRDFREYLLDFLVFLFNDSVGMFSRVSSKISLGIVFPSFFFRWWGCPWNYSQKFSCDASEFLTPAVSSSQRFSLDSSRSSSQILFQRLPRDCFQP